MLYVVYQIKHLQKHKNKFAICTDGSKPEVEVRFAIVRDNLKIESSLPSYTSFYWTKLSEVYAINVALNITKTGKLNNIII